MLTLKTKYTAQRTSAGFGEVVETLLKLELSKKGDPYLVLDDWPRGFVQVARTSKRRYIVEWRSRFQPRRPRQGLAHAQREKAPGKIAKPH